MKKIILLFLLIGLATKSYADNLIKNNYLVWNFVSKGLLIRNKGCLNAEIYTLTTWSG